jgi:ankyrin repeat protein
MSLVELESPSKNPRGKPRGIIQNNRTRYPRHSQSQKESRSKLRGIRPKGNEPADGTKRRSPRTWAAFCFAGLWCLSLVGCLDPEAQALLRRLQDMGVPPTGASVVKAITEKDQALLELLFAVQAPIDAVNDKGLSPLMIAVIQEDLSLVDTILQRATPELIEQTDPGGLTPLSYALVNKQRGIVEKLLDAGSNPNVEARQGESALSFAVRIQDSVLVAALLNKSKHPLAMDSLRQPLYLAVKLGNYEISDMLLEGGVDPNHFSTTDNKSPLCAAVEANDLEMARKLAARGAAMITVLPALSAATGSSDGEKFLEPHLMTVAFDHENMDLVHMLVEMRAPLDGMDANGMTPLKRALAKGNTELVQLLLDHGAKPDDTLIMALKTPDIGVIDMLLAHGASLDATNETGDTPLHIALDRNDLKLAKQLLEAEPNLEDPGRFGQNIVCVATAKQNVPFLKLLLEHGADPNTVFNPKLTEAFKELVASKKFQFYLRKDRGLTPIMLAANFGNVEMTKLLIDHGAKRFKNSRRYHRWPINFACEQEHIECAQLLLGRDPDSQRDVRVEISLAEQKAVLYENGEAVLSTTVSTGKKGYQTPQGRYVISNKSRHHTSSLYGSSMPYFQRLSCSDFGFHQGACPGYPASHGCIRMPRSDAKSLFGMTKVGDPVTIVP